MTRRDDGQFASGVRAKVPLAASAAAVVALAGALVLPAATPPVAEAAPPDLIPPVSGILPGPAPSDSTGTPGSWGPCVPDDDADDSCSGWLVPPGAVPPFVGTDNAPNVVVGGDFTVPDVADSAA
ncbi:hypothetical protein GCM10023216_16280 [Isoptericola chiayiensis]|uniref:Uncharacterized protein n=1 Tax=Isoptericola chiayiensis TaxID=579446 RepID=A0ABP8YFG1_9MICO|nr:hypothetical protein [Isoptericola chiayiensis]NOV99856.1 hypothetical protein [Isoptericola chiayiensis]